MTPAQTLLTGLQTRVRQTLQPAALDTFASTRPTYRNQQQNASQSPAQPQGVSSPANDILSALAFSGASGGSAGGVARVQTIHPGIPQGPTDPNYNPFPPVIQPPQQPQQPTFTQVPYFGGSRLPFLQQAYGTQQAGQGLSLADLLLALEMAGINPFQPQGTPTRSNPQPDLSRRR